MKLTKYIASVLLLMGVMFGQTKVFNIPIANFKNVVTVDDSLNVTGIASLNGGLILGNSSITGPATLTLGTTTTFDMGAVTTLDFDGAFAVTGGAMTASAGVTVDNIVINADALTSSNNLITIDGGTAGVRLDNSIGIGASPSYTIHSVQADVFAGATGSAENSANIYLDASARTAGQNNYGGAIAFGKLASSSRKDAAIVAKQTGSDDDQLGLSFWVHPSAAVGDAMVEKMVLDHDGNLEVQSSLDLSGASAGQIQFPASQNASAGVNTLDDYEENNYSPTVAPATSGSYTLTASKDLAAYIKIGRMVFYSGELDISGSSSPVGEITVSLPFNLASYTDRAEYSVGSVSVANHGGSIAGHLTAYVTQGDVTTFRIRQITDAGTASNLDATDVDATFQITFSIMYHASS